MLSDSHRTIVMLSPKNIYLNEVNVATDVATVKLYNKFGHFATYVQSHDRPDLIVIGKRTFEDTNNSWLSRYATRKNIPLLLIDNLTPGPRSSFTRAGQEAKPGEQVYPSSTVGVIHPEVLTMPDLFGRVATAVAGLLDKPEAIQPAIHDVVIEADIEYDPDFTTHYGLALRQAEAGMPISSSSMGVPSRLELNGQK